MYYRNEYLIINFTQIIIELYYKIMYLIVIFYFIVIILLEDMEKVTNDPKIPAQTQRHQLLLHDTFCFNWN